MMIWIIEVVSVYRWLSPVSCINFFSGMFCMRGRRGVSSGTNLRPSHCDPCWRAGGPYQLLPGPRVLWGTHCSAWGCFGSGAGPYGYVHRARHPLLKVQTSEDEGAPGALLVQSQHPKGRVFLSLCVHVCPFQNCSFFCQIKEVACVPWNLLIHYSVNISASHQRHEKGSRQKINRLVFLSFTASSLLTHFWWLAAIKLSFTSFMQLFVILSSNNLLKTLNIFF